VEYETLKTEIETLRTEVSGKSGPNGH
jgi:hypothetical protein